jgi:CBS domain containing-hemolysin-like protein
MDAMEEFPITLRFLLIPVLLAINGFFAAAEVALVSARETRMRQLAEAGESRARAVLRLLANPDRLLSATQLGVTLASLGLGWAGQETVYGVLEPLFAAASFPQWQRVAHVVAFAVAFLVVTFLHMVVGEVVPKNLAMERTERLALAVGPTLEIFARATDAFVRVVERASHALSRLLGWHGPQPGAPHSIEEIKLIVSASRRHGEMLSSQEEMLHSVMDFHDLTAREVMVPRSQMRALEAGATPDQVIRFLVEHRHSRIPVYEGSPEHVIGILYAKEVWPLWQEQQRAAAAGRPAREFQLRAMIHPRKVVPETKPLNELLAEFQKSRTQMAMVVDEFGTIVGLVTVEDALEQIVGEIREEHELPEPARARDDAPTELDGITNIRDLENLHNIRLPYDAGFETLAGFLLERLGAIPQGGEAVEHEGRRFTVIEMKGRRIGRVRVEKIRLVEQPSNVSV